MTEFYQCLETGLPRTFMINKLDWINEYINEYQFYLGLIDNHLHIDRNLNILFMRMQINSNFILLKTTRFC